MTQMIYLGKLKFSRKINFICLEDYLYIYGLYLFLLDSKPFSPISFFCHTLRSGLTQFCVPMIHNAQF